MKKLLLLLIISPLLLVGCNYLQSDSVQFLNQKTNTPIVNENIEVYNDDHPVCEVGVLNCPQPVLLFKGKTNNDGIIKLPPKISRATRSFRIEITSGDFKNRGVRISHKWITAGKEFDPNNLVIDGIFLPPDEKGIRQSYEEELNINEETIIIKIWPGTSD